MEHFWPSETTLLFKCCYCDVINTEMKTVSHLVRHHVKPELAPWRCSLCGFQAISRQVLGNHVNHHQHIQEVKRRPGERCDFVMSKKPYTVKIGIDYMIVTDEYPVKESCSENRKRKAPPPDISPKRTQFNNISEYLPSTDATHMAARPKALQKEYPQPMEDKAIRKNVNLDEQTQVSGMSKIKNDRHWLTANWINNNGDPIGKTSTRAAKENADEVPHSKLLTSPANAVPARSTSQKSRSSGDERRTGSHDTMKTLPSYKTTSKTKMADISNKINKPIKSGRQVSNPPLNKSESDKLHISMKKNAHTNEYAAKTKSKSGQKNVQTQTHRRDTADGFEMNGSMLMDAITALSAALQPIKRIETSTIQQDRILTVVIPLLQTVARVLDSPKLQEGKVKDKVEGKRLK